MEAVEKARFFAAIAHEAVGDRRRFTGDRVEVHVGAVAGMLKKYGYDDDTVAAGWLHDVVEDTKIEDEFLRKHFSEKTCLIVGYSSKVTVKEDGTRRERTRMDHEHYSKGPEESQTLKLCDSMDNTPSMCDSDPKFAKLYVREKTDLHGRLTKAHPQAIKDHADMLARCRKKLGIDHEGPSGP